MEKTLEKFDRKKIGEMMLDYSLYIVLGLMIIGVIVYEPSFLDGFGNIRNILVQASTRGILAMGVAGLIVLQGTDLAVGRVVGLTAMVSASLLQSSTYAQRFYPNLPDAPIWIYMMLALAAAVAIGALFGAINGFGVAKLHVHAFIITLGTQLIAQGALCLYCELQPNGAQPVASLNDSYIAFVNGTLFDIPLLIIYLALVSVVMWVIWNKTKLGKNMYAIGGNPDAAAVSGVNVTKNIMWLFILSGVLYGLGGFLEAARIGSTSTTTGTNYELDAISACVIGGVSFTGGIGTIPGVLIGTIILQFITYGLNFVGINPYWQYIIKGLIIILAVAIDMRKYIAKK